MINNNHHLSANWNKNFLKLTKGIYTPTAAPLPCAPPQWRKPYSGLAGNRPLCSEELGKGGEGADSPEKAGRPPLSDGRSWQTSSVSQTEHHTKATSPRAGAPAQEPPLCPRV